MVLVCPHLFEGTGRTWVSQSSAVAVRENNRFSNIYYHHEPSLVLLLITLFDRILLRIGGRQRQSIASAQKANSGSITTRNV